MYIYAYLYIHYIYKAEGWRGAGGEGGQVGCGRVVGEVRQ